MSDYTKPETVCEVKASDIKHWLYREEAKDNPDLGLIRFFKSILESHGIKTIAQEIRSDLIVLSDKLDSIGMEKYADKIDELLK